jgi:probable addiction module antidote protein
MLKRVQHDEGGSSSEEKDAALIRTGLNDVARAKGMTGVAAASKITRQALCAIWFWALGPNGNMTLETLLGVLRAMGVRLSVSG